MDPYCFDICLGKVTPDRSSQVVSMSSIGFRLLVSGRLSPGYKPPTIEVVSYSSLELLNYSGIKAQNKSITTVGDDYTGKCATCVKHAF